MPAQAQVEWAAAGARHAEPSDVSDNDQQGSITTQLLAACLPVDLVDEAALSAALAAAAAAM